MPDGLPYDPAPVTISPTKPPDPCAKGKSIAAEEQQAAQDPTTEEKEKE